MERRSAGSFLNPRALSPYFRAAFTTLLALVPSRETPHEIRSSSSGTLFPKYARIMESAAAPHSTASICKTVGVLTRGEVETFDRLKIPPSEGRYCFIARSENAEGSSQGRKDQCDRLLPTGNHLGRAQCSAG